MYFSFIKMIILYFFLRFLICDGFNLITSYIYGNYCDSKTDCQPALWNYASMVNNKNQKQFIQIQNILNLATIVLTILFFFFYRKGQYNLNKAIDKNQQT